MEARVWLDGASWEWRHGAACDHRSPVFEIGSVGKVFTTTLLALLQQRGTVGLSDPVGRYLSGLPWGESVTLEQLASHTSGVPSNPVGSWRLLWHGRELAERFGPEDLKELACRLPATLRGAGKVRYSNVGMALLGAALGEAHGTSYRDAVTELILIPLGMKDTGVEPDAFKPERLIEGHDRRGRPVPPFVWPGMEPAGVWRSTGDDVLTFLRAHLEMTEAPWKTVVETVVSPLARMTRDTEVGLGWMLSSDRRWGRMAWHNGSTFGQHCIVGWTVDGKAAVALLTDRIPPLWHNLVASRQLELLPVQLLNTLA